MSEALAGELLPVGAPLPTTPVAGGARAELEGLLREWLVGYGSANTRAAYTADLAHWLAFLAASTVDPLTQARRVHTHAWLRAQEAEGAATATRARRLAAVSAFYAWLIAEDYTDRANPAAIDSKRKPKVNPYRTTTSGLSKEQAGDLLAAADADDGPQALRTAAIVAVLLYTGIRVGELVGADVDQLGQDGVLQLSLAFGGAVDAVQVDTVFALPFPHHRGGYVNRERQGVEVGSLLP